MSEPQLSPADVLEERVSDLILSQQKTAIAKLKMEALHEILWVFFKSEVERQNPSAIALLPQLEILLQHVQ